MNISPDLIPYKDINIFRGNEPHFPNVQTAIQLSALIDADILDHIARGISPTLLPKSPKVLLDQFTTGRNVIMMNHHGIVGFAAFYELAIIQGVLHSELGTVVVKPDMRHQGIGQILYNEIETLHNSLGGILYGTTKSERVVTIGRYHGLTPIPFTSLEASIRKAICYEAPCFTPTLGVVHLCQRQYDAGGDCWLRARYMRS